MLSYSLPAVSVPVCHLNGKEINTDKYLLSKLLYGEIESEAPNNINILIYDSFFLQIIINFDVKRIDIISDRYPSPSVEIFDTEKMNHEHHS